MIIIFWLLVIALVLYYSIRGEEKESNQEYKKSISRFKFGDKVVVEEEFYQGLTGTVVGICESDAWDCTIFEGFRVELDNVDKVIVTKNLIAA